VFVGKALGLTSQLLFDRRLVALPFFDPLLFANFYLSAAKFTNTFPAGYLLGFVVDLFDLGITYFTIKGFEGLWTFAPGCAFVY
jgi:hypothetical protein